MNRPSHERVNLKPTERAEFFAITQQLGPSPQNPATPSALGWRNRVRVVFYTHLAATAMLLPLGVAAMAVAILIWWPLGLLGAGLVVIGQLALFELLRAHHLRKRLRKQPHQRNP